jgi:hypothetical protein
MSNNINDLDFEEDELEVRAPDPVIKERLIDPYYNANYNTNYNTNSDFVQTSDADIAIILKQSLLEFELAEEQRIKDLIVAERNTMTKKYNEIKQKLQKVQGHDTTNKELYNTIISIIELYEADVIDRYALDRISCNNVFKLLQSIRLTKEELCLLEELIN